MIKDNPISSDALNHRFDLAQKGRAFWLKHDLYAYQRILLLPYVDSPMAAQAASALKGATGNFSSLSASGQMALICLSAAPVIKEAGIPWMQITEEEMESLITLYSMYEFTDKLMIVSQDKPYGRKLYNLLDAGIASGKELTDDVLLGALHGKEA